MANPSTHWNVVPVYATYRLLDGTPDSGFVSFTLAERITSATDEVIFSKGQSRRYEIGSETGTLAAEFPASDDPDISPNGWVIRVEEHLGSGTGETYYIQPKLTDLVLTPPGVNLRTVVPGEITNLSMPAFLRGVPGGVAALDDEGDVVNSEGVKVIAGGPGGGGESPDIRLSGGFIQWHLPSEGAVWHNIIATSALTGAAGTPGTPGTNGVDGNSPILQVADGFIQWRIDPDDTWANLISIASLTGADSTVPGPSAYDVWLGQGNTGTEQDFLDSISQVYYVYAVAGVYPTQPASPPSPNIKTRVFRGPSPYVGATWAGVFDDWKWAP